MNHNVLITIGAGFIGSRVVPLFVSNYTQYHIYSLDIQSHSGKIDNLTNLKNNENYTFIDWDVFNIKILDRLLKREVGVSEKLITYVT